MKTWKRRIAILLLGFILAISGTGYFSGEPINKVGTTVGFVLSPLADSATDQLILPEWDTEEVTSRNTDAFTIEAITGFHSIVAKINLNTILRIRKTTYPIQPLYLVNGTLLI